MINSEVLEIVTQTMCFIDHSNPKSMREVYCGPSDGSYLAEKCSQMRRSPFLWFSSLDTSSRERFADAIWRRVEECRRSMEADRQRATLERRREIAARLRSELNDGSNG